MNAPARTFPHIPICRRFGPFFLSALCIAVLILLPDASARCGNASSRPKMFQPAGPDTTQPLLTETLCRKGERPLFNCVTKETERTLSICASTDLDRDNGHLVYRFGTKDNIELEYPKKKNGSQRRFRYARTSRPGATFVKLWFNIGPYRYLVYDDYLQEEDRTTESIGVVVTLPSGRITDLECDPGGFSDLTELENVVPRRLPE